MSNPVFFSFDSPAPVASQVKGAERSPLFLTAIHLFASACGFSAWVSPQMKDAKAIPAVVSSDRGVVACVFASYGDLIAYGEAAKHNLLTQYGAESRVHLFYLKSYELLRDLRISLDSTYSAGVIEQPGLPAYQIGSMNHTLFFIKKSFVNYHLE